MRGRTGLTAVVFAALLMTVLAACAGGAPAAGEAPQQPAAAVQPQPAAPAADPSAPSMPSMPSTSGQAVAVPAAPGAMMEKPKLGGIMRVGHRADPTWDNTVSTSYSVVLLTASMYGDKNLMRNCRDEAIRMCPGLAESWETNDDFSQWTFKIRDGVVWHDGTPLVADDVTFWLDLFYNGVTVGDNVRPPGNARAVFGSIENVETLDGNRVRVTLEGPDPVWVERLGLHRIQMLHPRHLMEPMIRAGKVNVGPEDVNFVGTGPFVYQDYETSVALEVRRSDQYWEVDEQGQRLPYLDGIDFLIIREPNAMHAAFRTGRLDAGGRGRGYYAEPSMVPAYRKNLGDSVWFAELPGGTTAGIGFNATRPPFDDVRLRQAVSLWIDRQSAVEILGDGYGRIKTMMGDTSWSAPDFLTWPGYNPATKEADRTEAKRLIAEAGYANGVTLRISGPRHKATQIEWWQGALAGSGITVELDLMETAEYDERRSGSNYTALDTGASEDIPESLFATIGPKELSPRAGPVHNDPKIKEFFDRLALETTLDGRRSVYREMERYVMLDQVYLVQTFIGFDLIPFRDYVKGMYPPVYDPSDFTSYATVWLDN